MAPVDRSHTSSCWCSLSCIISDIERYIVRKSQFLISHQKGQHRPYTIYYWYAIVNNLVPFSNYLTLNNIVPLKSGLGLQPTGHSKSLKMVPFERFDTISYSHSIVTVAVSCMISELKRDICRKSRFFTFDANKILPYRFVWKY